MKQLGVIVPLYREEEVVAAFHARLDAALTPLRARYATEIVYVLDKSPDRTEERLQQICRDYPDVRVLLLSRRFGHQPALLAGIDHCRTDAVVMLDGDLQHPPELIPEMVAHWEQGADVVQMIRRHDAANGFLKMASSGWFYRVLGRLAPVKLPPGSADFRLLSGRVAEVFRTRLREQNPFLRGLVAWVGYNVVLLPFDCPPREKGLTKYGLTRLVSFAVHGICSFSKAPLRLCTVVGISVSLLSFLLAAAQIVAYFLSDRDVPGWASLMLAIAFATGVQLFFVGVLGEYVGLIFEEVKRRPHYLVEKVYEGAGAAENAASNVPRRRGALAEAPLDG